MIGAAHLYTWWQNLWSILIPNSRNRDPWLYLSSKIATHRNGTSVQGISWEWTPRGESLEYTKTHDLTVVFSISEKIRLEYLGRIPGSPVEVQLMPLVNAIYASLSRNGLTCTWLFYISVTGNLITMLLLLKNTTLLTEVHCVSDII